MAVKFYARPACAVTTGFRKLTILAGINKGAITPSGSAYDGPRIYTFHGVMVQGQVFMGGAAEATGQLDRFSRLRIDCGRVNPY